MIDANKFNLLLDVAKQMHVLADGLEAVARAFSENKESIEKAKEEKTEKKVSLEDVRAVLAVKSQNGLTAEVRGLIEKYGATKLSDVKPEHYAGLLKDAEVLGNG